MWRGGPSFITLSTPISIPKSGVVNIAAFAPAGAKYVVLEGYSQNTAAGAYNDELIRVGGITMCSQRATGGTNYIACTGMYSVSSYSVEVLASNDGGGWFTSPAGWLRIVGYGT